MSSSLDTESLVAKIQEGIRACPPKEGLSLKEVCYQINTDGQRPLEETVDQRIIQDEAMALAVLESPEVRKLRLDQEWTLAHVAVIYHEQAARKAVQDPNICKLRNGAGQAVAHHIARSSYPNVIKTLFSEHTDVLDLMDEEGYSVLDEAIISNGEAVVRFFWDIELSPEKRRDVLLGLASLIKKELLKQALQDPIWQKNLSDELRTPLLTHSDPDVRQLAITALKDRNKPQVSEQTSRRGR